MNNTLIKSTLAALVLGGLTAAARADIAWDWSFTGSDNYSGPLVSGGRTLTTGVLGSGGTGGYLVTSISGTFAGNTVTSLSSYFGPDNTLWTPGNNGLGDDFLLSYYGLSFNDNTGDAGNFYDDFGDYFAGDAYDNYENIGTFTATEVTAAPEPSQVISLLSLAGMGGAGLLVRRFRNRK
jgi:hypothetical protein